MRRASVGVFAVCLGLVGCGGAERDAERAGDPERRGTAEVRPVPVTETGCLTARGNQFVLTDLERGEGDATTETFQLVGNEEQLRPHIGKQVRVNGEADAPRVAEVRESTPAPATPEPRGTTGGTANPGRGNAEPKVSTQTETRVEVRKLTVASIDPTGASCAAETKEGAEGSQP